MNTPAIFSRRKFLVQSAALTGLACAAPGTLLSHQLAVRALPLALNMLRHSDFEPHLGSRFLVQLEAGDVVELELMEANAHGSPASSTVGAASRAPFSLVFLGPASSPWPQRIYRLDHAAMGTLEIFLVPIGPDDRGRHRYEAVFT